MLGHAALPYFDQDGVHAIYRNWRRIFDEYPGDRVGVAEAWAPSVERLANYTRPDELHQAFNFHFLGIGWHPDALRRVIAESVTAAAAVGAPPTWVLGNHDVQRQVTRFGDGAGGLARARAAALLMLALPGSTYLYQGEELGLAEVLDLPEESLQDPVWQRSGRTQRGRDGCRVPLPWSGDAAAFGFSIGVPWLPQPAHWAELAVDRQRDDPASVLSLYRSALRLRRSISGELRWLDAPGNVLAFARGHDLVCTVNVGDAPVVINRPGTVLLSSGGQVEDEPAVVLPGATTVWWQAGGSPG
jgi:alpha-glucosidase